MANRNSAGWGLRPAGTLGNTPSTQGLSQYWIDAGATVDLVIPACAVVTYPPTILTDDPWNKSAL